MHRLQIGANQGKLTVKIFNRNSLDSDGNITHYDKSKTEYTYNNTGKLTIETYYDWENYWRLSWKSEYTYDNTGNRTMIEWYFWDNNSWKIHSKIEYTYNNQGKLILENHYGLDNNQWEYYDKIEYAYDNNGNLIMRAWYNYGNNIIAGGGKDEWAYDNNGDLTMKARYDWNNNSWQGDRKEEYAYDNNRNLTMKIWGYWDNNSWKKEGKEEYAYNLSYSKAELVFPSSVGEMNNMLTEITHFRWNGTDWVMNGGTPTTYYWSPKNIAVTGISEIASNSAVVVYPNPTTGIISVEQPAAIKIYSLQGVLLQATFGTQADLSPYPNGIYILQVNGTRTKIVKL